MTIQTHLSDESVARSENEGLATLSPTEAACIAGGARMWKPLGMTADGMIFWGWVDE